jgi:hypothetical protein
VAVVVVAQLLHLWHHHQVRLVCVCVSEQIHFVARRITIPVAKQVGRLTYKLHVHLTA